MGISAGEIATASDVLEKVPFYPTTASTVLLISSLNSENTTSATTYTKREDIAMAGSGTFRIQFAIRTSASTATAYGRVYQNGVAVGTEQSETASTQVIKSEDISGWELGDLCQLYTKIASGNFVFVQNFNIYASTNKSEFQVL